MSTVDQATTETAAIVRRMVSRTLVVVGGSFAVTAVAWAISSASASAESTCDAPVPGLADVVQSSSVESALSGVVCGVEEFVPPAAADPIKDLGEQAARTVYDFTDHFGQINEFPIDVDDIGRSDLPGAHPAPGGGAHEPPSLVQPVGEQPAAAPSPVVAPVVAPVVDDDVLARGGAKDRALADGMTRRGSPEPVRDAQHIPFAPGKPASLPMTPVSVPASGSAGHPGGGADYSAFAAVSWPTGRFGLPSGQSLAVRHPHHPDRPGSQPGVTPD